MFIQQDICFFILLRAMTLLFFALPTCDLEGLSAILCAIVTNRDKKVKRGITALSLT